MREPGSSPQIPVRSVTGEWNTRQISGEWSARPNSGEWYAPTRAAPEAERRQLTVMFCDLVGSTKLSGEVDPEDLRDLIRAYQDAAEGVVQRYEGHVAQHLGDGLLVYFGYPRAHENDAERAIRAGLEIVEAMGPLNERLKQEYSVNLAVRIGVHTGPVVVGSVGLDERQEQLAIGEAPNVAARVQGEAEPGEVVASARTMLLVQGYFEHESLGARALKGLGEPLELFKIVRPTGARTRLEARDVESAPFVGRDAEKSSLLQLWNKARDGNGGVVIVSGEPGIGKSRLILDVRQQITDGFVWLHTSCSPYYGDTPLRPIIDMARPLWGINHDDGPDERATQLASAVDRLGLGPDAAQLIAGVIGLPLPPDRYPPLAMSPQVRRKHTLDVLATSVLELSRSQPVILCIEDVHWVDHSTLDFLALLAERARTAPVLVVLLCRPQFKAPWPVDAELILRALHGEQARKLVAQHAAPTVLSAEVVDQIISKSDGNPLFLEELTRTFVESSAAGSSTSLAIPTTLQDSLFARIDRLGPSKSLIQLGATIGRQFAFEVLQDVLRAVRDQLDAELQRLIDSELVSQQGVPPWSTYSFRHALIRDAAYESLTHRTRRDYHSRLSTVLKERFPDTAPEVLAHHFGEGGLALQAAEHWLIAGQTALGSFSLAESMGHLTKGLECLKTQPDSPERLGLELSLRVMLGVPLMLTRGFAAQEVKEHYGQVYDLCLVAGESATAQLFPALFGLWTFSEVSADYAKAQEMGERLLDLAARVGDSGIQLGGHIAYGAARLMRGDLATARKHFEKGLDVYDMAQHAPLAMVFGQDGGAMCAAFLTWVHAHEGNAEAGHARAAQALQMCDALGQPGTRGFVQCVLASFYCLLEEYEQGALHSDSVIALAAQEGMPHWAAQGAINRGWAVGRGDQAAEAAESIRQSIAGLRALGTRASMTYFLGSLVQVELSRGELDAAAEVLGQALTFAEETGESFYEAELRRFAGEIALARGAKNDATAAFERAIQIAQSQGAAGFVARAQARLAEVQSAK